MESDIQSMFVNIENRKMCCRKNYKKYVKFDTIFSVIHVRGMVRDSETFVRGIVFPLQWG